MSTNGFDNIYPVPLTNEKKKFKYQSFDASEKDIFMSKI
jgi:hypothetical protein